VEILVVEIEEFSSKITLSKKPIFIFVNFKVKYLTYSSILAYIKNICKKKEFFYNPLTFLTGLTL